MNAPERSETSESKEKPKISPPPEWLEIPKITRGVNIPTSSGLRSGHEVELIVEENAESNIALSENKIPSKELPISTPTTPIEWLELPKLAQVPTGTIPTVAKEALKSATGPVITPKPPMDVPVNAKEPLKCPHCGTILTQAQLDLKATGTKVLCSECFNMV